MQQLNIEGFLEAVTGDKNQKGIQRVSDCQISSVQYLLYVKKQLFSSVLTLTFKGHNMTVFCLQFYSADSKWSKKMLIQS